MGLIMLTEVILLICIGASVGNDPLRRSADDERCGPNKYYDEQRLVCLDLCGRNNETHCKIERYCSTKVSWGIRINPPRCLPHCIRRCDSPWYCDHEESDCRPCDSLCSPPDVTQCRKYCYDVYLLLTTTSPDTTTSQDITTSQTTTSDRDRVSRAALNVVVQSSNRSWKTIAVVLSCVTAVLLCVLVALVGSSIRYCQKSASMADGEADKRLLSTKKQGEPDTPNMGKTTVNPA